MKIFLHFQLILLIGLPYKSMSQDTILLTKQRKYLVKVIEVENEKVKYRKFENLEGPIYSVNKNEILAIRYQNGSIDTFSAGSSGIVEPVVTKDNFLTWIKGPNIAVYVGSDDPASIIHARKALQSITSWHIVEDPSKSQIIIRFDFVSIGIGDKKGKAQFFDPKTNDLLFETRTVNTAMSLDMNTKRGVIDKIVRKEIRKLLKD